MRASHTNYTARPQAPKHLAEVVVQIWQVLDHVMGIKTVDLSIAERQLESQISPDVWPG
jgi:hypothetical protein